MPARRTASAAVAPTSIPRRGQGGNPGCLLLIGVAFLVASVLIMTLQIQTSEAYLQGTQNENKEIVAQWDIWLQIPRLAFGDRIPGPAITSKNLVSIIIAQVVELVHVALIAGATLAFQASKRWGRLFGTLAIVFLLFIAIFNFSADFAYGDVSLGEHIFFACICTFAIGFFPTWGFILIEWAYKQL